MDHLTEVMAFVATANPDLAKEFYRDVLGLALIEDTPFALVFDTGGTILRVQKTNEVVPAPSTVLGWKVADIHAAIAQLSGKHVKFTRYDWIAQDDAGVWTAPDGTKVAWFLDPDGNNLSLTQFGP